MYMGITCKLMSVTCKYVTCQMVAQIRTSTLSSSSNLGCVWFQGRTGSGQVRPSWTHVWLVGLYGSSSTWRGIYPLDAGQSRSFKTNGPLRPTSLPRRHVRRASRRSPPNPYPHPHPPTHTPAGSRESRRPSLAGGGGAPPPWRRSSASLLVHPRSLPFSFFLAAPPPSLLACELNRAAPILPCRRRPSPSPLPTPARRTRPLPSLAASPASRPSPPPPGITEPRHPSSAPR